MENLSLNKSGRRVLYSHQSHGSDESQQENQPIVQRLVLKVSNQGWHCHQPLGVQGEWHRSIGT